MREVAAEPEISSLLGLADQCVKCGYCLPHCPTFKLARDEGESPRGRIALIQGWLSGAISDGPRVQFHLDQCLECRACEPSCPSLVRYGALMDGARAVREQRRPMWQRWPRRLQLALLTRPAGLRLIAAIGTGYRWLRLPQAVIDRASRYWPAIQILDPLARALCWPRRRNAFALSEVRRAANPSVGSGLSSNGDSPSSLSRSSAEDSTESRYSHSGAERNPVSSPSTAGLGEAVKISNSEGLAPALFRGCIARLTDQPLEATAFRLLTRLGYPPEVPIDQGCCGAIHRHNGYPAEADQQIAANAKAFAGRAVVGLASACVAELREQGQTQAQQINAIEICRFLLDRPWPANVSLQPLPVTVAVHEPCSHRNQLRDQVAVYQLLQRIPELSVTSLPGNDSCCGAAGTYLTEHPDIALALAAPKVDALRHLQPDYLVTTNTGCALHLSARLRSAGLTTQVLHPLQLIEQQLYLSTQPAATDL